MTLSWDLPPFDQINGHVRHYIVVVTERETASEFQEQPTNTQVTIQSLHPYYTYICRVAAVTTGPGPYTGNLTIQLPEDGKISLNNIIILMYLTTMAKLYVKINVRLICTNALETHNYTSYLSSKHDIN